MSFHNLRVIHANKVYLFMLLQLVLTTILAVVCVNYVKTRPEQMAVVVFQSPEPVEYWHNSTTPIQSVAFFRFTQVEGSNYVGSYTFDQDVYLVGASTIACSSKPQVYEITIRSGLEHVAYTLTESPDAYGNAPFDWVDTVFFQLRIDSTHGVNEAHVFLPYGYGLYLPEGDAIHFHMGSNELGSGGTFNVYFVEASA